MGLLAVHAVSPLSAQQRTPVSAAAFGSSYRYDTRAQLDSLARVAERQNRPSEAWLLRSRLRAGDFQEGDRIIVILEGSLLTIDTLQVRTGKRLEFPRMGDVSLEGVLRVELTDTLRHHLSRYLANPNLRATPLLPIAVIGNVGAPGYYYSPADVVLRDVIMRAGGPRGDADLNRVVVRRGGETIWNAEAVRVALNDGLSLDRLHLRAGDEVFVPARRQFQVSNVLPWVSTALAVWVAWTQIQQR